MYQASMPVLSMDWAGAFFTTFFLRLGARFLLFLGPPPPPEDLPNFPPPPPPPPCLPPNLPPLPGLPGFPPNDFFLAGLRPPLNIGIKTPVYWLPDYLPGWLPGRFNGNAVVILR